MRERDRVVAEILGGRFPVYETPAANLRATKVAYEDLATLEGEEQAAREWHIKDLIDTANAQQVILTPGGAVFEFRRPEGKNAGATDRRPAQHSSTPRPSGRNAQGSNPQRAPSRGSE